MVSVTTSTLRQPSIGGRYGPLAPIRALVEHRVLIRRLAAREIVSRYQGSALGVLWLLLAPLLQLLIYTFVFAIVFKAKWDLPEQGRLVFAVVFFSGLIVYNVFAECMNRGPRLILENPNYVKRLVFPLEIMPWVALLSAMFNFAIGLVLLLAIYLIQFGLPPVSALSVPVIVLPLLLMTIGLTYWLAATGVYLRDLAQIVVPLTMLMMFVTPIFYSIDIVPEAFQPFIRLNPISSVLGQLRACLFRGDWPDPVWLIVATGLGWAVLYAGYAWFEKTKKGFADVV